MSEISDDFQNSLIFAHLIRNIDIENNLFEKNVEIEQMFLYNKDWRAIHTKSKIENIDKSEMEKGRWREWRYAKRLMHCSRKSHRNASWRESTASLNTYISMAEMRYQGNPTGFPYFLRFRIASAYSKTLSNLCNILINLAGSISSNGEQDFFIDMSV